MQNMIKKSRIREKKNLSTDADSRTNTILEMLHEKIYNLTFPPGTGTGRGGSTNERPGSDHVIWRPIVKRNMFRVMMPRWETGPDHVLWGPIVKRNIFSGYWCHGGRWLCSPGTSFAPLGESHGEGTLPPHVHKRTDIATTRKNRPKGRFFENVHII